MSNLVKKFNREDRKSISKALTNKVEAIDSFQKALKQQIHMPSFKAVKVGDNGIDIAPMLDLKKDENLLPFVLGIFKLTGSCDTTLHADSHYKLAKVMDANVGTSAVQRAAALMQALNPLTPEEGLLTIQMAAVHEVAMQMLARATHPQNTSHVVDMSVCRAVKLLNVYANHQALLDRKRHGHQTTQKVIVEKVEVQSGGQAIVGTVTGGGRQKKKNEG